MNAFVYRKLVHGAGWRAVIIPGPSTCNAVIQLIGYDPVSNLYIIQFQSSVLLLRLMVVVG